MIGRRYIVQRGDTLWSIAEQHLGGGREWPRIWHYSNRPEVVRQIGRPPQDPMHLRVGQVLLLPVLSALPRVPRAKPGGMSLAVGPSVPTGPGSTAFGMCMMPAPGLAMPRQPLPAPPANRGPDALPQSSAAPFAIQYSLDDIRLPPILHPQVVFAISMSGEVALTSRTRYPTLSLVDNRDLELKLTHAANQAFSRLVQEVKLDYDREKRTLSYSALLVSRSTTPHAPSTAVGVANSKSGLPVLRFEFRFDSLEGSVDGFWYVGAEVTVTIDVSPHLDGLLRERPERRQERAWDLQLTPGRCAVGVILVGGALIAAFLLLPAAGAMAVTVALLLIVRAIAAAGGAGGGEVPRAALPAMVDFRLEISTRKA